MGLSGGFGPPAWPEAVLKRHFLGVFGFQSLGRFWEDLGDLSATRSAGSCTVLCPGFPGGDLTPA